MSQDQDHLIETENKTKNRAWETVTANGTFDSQKEDRDQDTTSLTHSRTYIII